MRNGQPQTTAFIDALDTEAAVIRTQTPASSTNDAGGAGRANSHDDKAPGASPSAVADAAPLADKLIPSQQPIVPAAQSLIDQKASEQQSKDTAANATPALAAQNTAAHDPAAPADTGASRAAFSTHAREAAAADQNADPQDDATASPTTGQAAIAPPQNVTAVASLPPDTVLPDAGSALAVAGNPGQNPASAVPKISDAATTPAPATGRTSAADAPTEPSDIHGVQSNGSVTAAATTQAANPAVQHVSDITQAKAPDNSPAAIQTVGTGAAVHDASARRAGDGVSDSPRSGELTPVAVSVPRENGESTPTSAINTARLIQTMNETGMQVGMRSAEFGDISIRTSVSQQQMLAQISVDHGDLGRAIAMHVPAVQSKLGEEFGLRATIQVHQSAASFSGEQGNASSGQQKPYARPLPVESLAPENDILTPGTAVPAWDGNRLDVRA
jgi:hypothetical protein